MVSKSGVFDSRFCFLFFNLLILKHETRNDSIDAASALTR